MKAIAISDEVALGDENHERRGASGARIIVGPTYTTKLDVARTGTFVRDQGAWLSRWAVERGVTILPKVSEISPDGYTMETAEVPHLSELDVTETCQRIFAMIQEQLWPKQTGGMYVHDNFTATHRAYVRDLLRDVEPNRIKARDLDKVMRWFYDRIDWSQLQAGLTHGDCIIDNVGFRIGTDRKKIVILDPIPASDALPNWRCVDVGRIIQSMVGYESVRYQRRGINVDFDAAVTTVLNWYMPKNFEVNEARACAYFSVIHTLRAVRTTVPGATRLSVWYLVNKLIEVTESWML